MQFSCCSWQLAQQSDVSVDLLVPAAGASWSSLDYGGVWKPLHYCLGRWFADLALSVRHDLHNDTIQVGCWLIDHCVDVRWGPDVI
jgi:hypothetical protein